MNGLRNAGDRLFVEDTGFGMFEPEAPPAPVRTIAITPELLAEEAARQAAREVQPPSDWAALKATLSEENLRRNLKKCKGCGKVLWSGAVTDRCRECSKAQRSETKAAKRDRLKASLSLRISARVCRARPTVGGYY